MPSNNPSDQKLSDLSPSISAKPEQGSAASDTDPSEQSDHGSVFYRWAPTFMRRTTHMNTSAKLGLSEAYQHWFAPISSSNLSDLFAKPEQPLTLEIGFGMGHTLIQMAQNDPKRNFVGVEVHEPGLGLTAFEANRLGLSNLKLIKGDALKLLENLPEGHLDTVQLYFPDPWQKKRHHKRRFVSPERMALVIRALKTGGIFHTATDWEHYAYWMIEVLDGLEPLQNVAGRGNFHPRPDFRPLTKFEKRGINSGHGVWDLIYRKL